MEPCGELFLVYGSLKRNFHNHSILNNAVFLGEYLTDTLWAMYAASPRGGYPVVTDGDSAIQGELYLCDEHTIERLDILESNGYHYERELIWIPELNIQAWMYIYLYDVQDEFQHPQEPFVEINRETNTHTWKQNRNLIQNFYRWWIDNTSPITSSNYETVSK